MPPLGMLVVSVVIAVSLPVVHASLRVVTTAGDALPAGEIDHQLALFGRPTFGAGLVAPLALAPASDRDACQPLDPVALAHELSLYEVSTNDGVDGRETEPFVLLVERGNCHFVDKARHAQRAGAAAVVVYDTGDDAAKLPVLADDGTGSDIHIPALLIHHKDAQALITQLEAPVKTIVAIHEDVPHPDDRVKFSLWFSSRSSPSLHTFIATFRKVVAALGTSVLFTPQYDIHVGSAWGCSKRHGDARPLHCPDLCILNQQFCTYDPERNNTIGLDGKDVLEEDVRQLCIYEHVQASTNSSALFWEYLTRFNANCSVADATSRQFNQACSETVQRALGIPTATIAACTENETTATTLLQSQIDALRTFHVIEFPELTVNGVPLFGGLTCDAPISMATCAPLHMICAGFADGHAPEACQDTHWKTSETDCTAPLERDECGVCSLRDSPLWNYQCVGCDDVPHSGKRVDQCGVCGGDGTFDTCGRCLPASDPTRDSSCVDCKGVPHGEAKRDACGVCDGRGSFDACGLCLDVNDPRRQNFACHVMEDPDAVAGKVEIRGVGMKQFHGHMLASFQDAVGFLTGVEPNQVFVKTVDGIDRHAPALTVLFFVACESVSCRHQVTKQLNDPSAAHLIAMKMKSSLDEYEYGLETSKMIEHVALQSVNAAIAQSASAVLTAPSLAARESPTWLIAVVACALTLAVGGVLMRVRDDRMRRDVRELFARYTPLTTMDFGDDDHDIGRHPSAGADAW